MAILNKVINYSSSATTGGILGALKDAMVALGWTVLEDSISGSSLFVVQAQQQSPSTNQQILEFRYFAPSDEYIAIIPWDSWTPGTPGSGGNSVYALDQARNSNAGLSTNYLAVDTTNGGLIFVDGDTDGSIVLVTGGTYENTWTPGTYLGIFGVLDGKVDGTYPNYGALLWRRSADLTNITSFMTDDKSVPCFVVPTNEQGTASAQMQWQNEVCCYEHLGVGMVGGYNTENIDVMRMPISHQAEACLDGTYDMIYPLIFGNLVEATDGGESYNVEYGGQNSGGRPATMRGALSGIRVLEYCGNVGVRCITKYAGGVWTQYRAFAVTRTLVADSKNRYEHPIALPFTGDNFVFVES